MCKPSSIIFSSQPTNASKKGAYRLFSNPKITQEATLKAHREQTVSRCKAHQSTIYVIQDTTDISVNNNRRLSEDLGHNVRRSKENMQVGNSSYHVHTSFCVADTGIPLGIIEQEIYTHANQGVSLKQTRKQRPIEEKESYRWIKSLRACKQYLGEMTARVVMLSDRESDIYEYLQEATELSQEVILRARPHRNALAQAIESMDCKGFYDFLHKEHKTWHRLSVAYDRLTLTAPKRQKSATSKALKPVDYYVIHAKEENPEAGSEAIEWILLTNIPVKNLEDARNMIIAYGQRWHIENFHKVLKTSFKLEEARLETFDGLKILATTMSILAYRLYYMIHFSRMNPDLPCTHIVETSEWKATWIYLKKKIPKETPSCHEMITNIAILGGYMNRKSDKKPGILLITRGWLILKDIHSLYLKLVGNR